ncbi:hypothetical protein [Dickeya lacustris]|uniref:Uncharacterized protein n=1 Tax=Dickeya lacustris TaxID=2259638 RepID=A0ABY8G9A0_9GAMM|nr:hypothetical protein [Dickeya lacustris]WFN56554.1 hypothetical protein O1Q98_04490 [Dickeya lacustris]
MPDLSKWSGWLTDGYIPLKLRVNLIILLQSTDVHDTYIKVQVVVTVFSERIGKKASSPVLVSIHYLKYH